MKQGNWTIREGTTSCCKTGEDNLNSLFKKKNDDKRGR